MVADDGSQSQPNGFTEDQQSDGVKVIGGYDHHLVSSDPNYHARNLYYFSSSSQLQSSASAVKCVDGYDDHQDSACNNWVPTAVPTVAPRSANMAAVCHGAPATFTVWNDT